MKDSKDYLKHRKHCELTVVVHYSAEANCLSASSLCLVEPLGPLPSVFRLNVYFSCALHLSFHYCIAKNLLLSKSEVNHDSFASWLWLFKS